MQKATIFVLIILGIISGLIFAFLLNPAFLLTYFFNPSCASIGVTHLTDKEIQEISNDPFYKDIMTLSSNDIKELPELPGVIRKATNKVEFNQESRLAVSYEEMQDYYTFFTKQFEEHLGFKPYENQESFWFIYNEKKYLIIGFLFNNTSFPIDIVEFETELVVAKDPVDTSSKIILTPEELRYVPRIKKALDEIGTFRMPSYEGTGIQESNLDRYGKWFEMQYEKQFGNATGKPYTHFKYNEHFYYVTFSIC